MKRLLLVVIAACGSTAPRPKAPPVTPAVEAWFASLADDAAQPAAWIDAADQLTTRTSDDVPFAGEGLRARRGPSVTELLAKRVASADIEVACPLAYRLLQWDPAAGKPIAARVMGQAIAKSNQVDTVRCITDLAEQRTDAGDDRALDDYAAWVVSVEPSTSGAGDRDAFLPMVRHPKRPSIAKAAEHLFRDGSPWLPVVSPIDRGRMDSHFFLQWHVLGPRPGSFLDIAAFNRHVVAALADKRAYAKLTVDADGITLEGANETSSVGIEHDPSAPPVGTQLAARICDYYAFALSGHEGAPPFRMYWPLAQRDQALAATIAWVKSQLK